jgi:hypothetical protein
MRTLLSFAVFFLFGVTATVTQQPKIYPLRITTGSLPDGKEGVPYHALVCATGGTLPYNWSQIAGQLPPGLSWKPTSDFHGRCIAIDGVPQ